MLEFNLIIELLANDTSFRMHSNSFQILKGALSSFKIGYKINEVVYIMSKNGIARFQRRSGNSLCFIESILQKVDAFTMFAS